MRRMMKLLMVLLSYAPIATVAVAAQAKANELEGEIQSFKLRQKIQGARFRLIPTYHMGTSMEAARKRYAEITGLKGKDLDLSIKNDLNKLSDEGLIQFDEKKIQAMGPSEYES